MKRWHAWNNSMWPWTQFQFVVPMSTPETPTDTANVELGHAVDAYRAACADLAVRVTALETARLELFSANTTYQLRGDLLESAKVAEKDARRQLQRALAGVDLVE